MAAAIDNSSANHHSSKSSPHPIYPSPQFSSRPQLSLSTPPGTNSRRRTSSLLSTVSQASMPLFSGRLSFSGWNKDVSAGTVRASGSNGDWKGKKKASDQNLTTPSKPPVTKAPRSKSILLARRASNPVQASKLDLSLLHPSTSRTVSDESPLVQYEERAGTFSRSTPDLCGTNSSPFQPLYLSPDDKPTSPSKRRHATPSPTKRHRGNFVATTVRHSPRPPSSSESESSDDESGEQFLTATSSHPAPPNSQTRSRLFPRSPHGSAFPLDIPVDLLDPLPMDHSPPQSPASRAAAHAEALAKLTEAAPPTESSSQPRKRSPSTPFPTRPPPPTPENPSILSSPVIDSLVDASPSVSISSSSDEHHRSSSDMGSRSRSSLALPLEEETPKILSADRIVLRPITPGARTRKLSARVSRSGAKLGETTSEEGFAKTVAAATRFLQKELQGDFISGDSKLYDEPWREEEARLWACLSDGVALCLLLNSLSPASPPIPSTLIDRRGLSPSRDANLTNFLAAAGDLYAIPPKDLFAHLDLLSKTRSGLRRVVHTLTIIEARSQGTALNARRASTASNTIEISGRSRPVRARSVNHGHHGRDGSGSTVNDVHSSSSPASSRFTDTSSARHSLDLLPIPRSPPPTGSAPNVYFADRGREPGVGSSSSSTSNNYKGKVYGDRKFAESAIDVLSVVEEDEGSSGRSTKAQNRHSQPYPLGRDESPPPPLPRPSPSGRRTNRFSSETLPWLDTSGDPLGKGSPPTLAARKRHSSDVARPKHPPNHRAFSHSATQPSSAEREKFGNIEISRSLAARAPSRRSSVASDSTSQRTSVPTSPVASDVPFPSSSSEALNDPLVIPGRPREHKRWNSELHIEKPMNRGDDFNFPPVVNTRTRHESFAVQAPNGEGMKSSPAARTKLVLREDGRPTLTYQLGECIGRGQFGSVYRALNLNSGRVVAVKRIQLEGKSEEEVSQLSQEVALLKSLDHPGVVKYEGVVRTEHYLNIVLEYVENGSLQKTIKHFGELPESLVASYVVKILEGLDYLHSSQVVHCDLKAANILSTKTGNIKLSDFGVSLNLNAVQNIKQDVPDVAGTPNWMAPEVIELRGASTASDIWSLGCTIIELITGKPPYHDLNAMSAMFRIVEDDRPPIPARCSPELSDFLVQCFAKDPRSRPTAAALFDHCWLQSHWEMHKELRPQDSIPFIRRISSDMRRPELNIMGAVSERSSPSSIDLGFFANSPLSTHAPSFPQVATTRSHELYLHESANVSSVLPVRETASDESHRAHAFVKTTFSKAVDCKLCHEPTKRHAVLCKECGLISHSRCSEFAPLPCDLRSQLVNYSKSYVPPRPTAASPANSPPATGASAFAMAVILPFSHMRRTKTSTPEVTFVPTSSPSKEHRQFSDIIKTGSRSPEPSVAAPRNGSIGSRMSVGRERSSGSSEGEHMGSSLGAPPVSEPSRSAISLLLNRRSSESPLKKRTSTIQSGPPPPSGASKLYRNKSHSRTNSQPVKKTEDCVVQ
ncbi:hypothetical protein P7C70_g3845, partial [Phenoliferia sp. Uapishka_3]